MTDKDHENPCVDCTRDDCIGCEHARDEDEMLDLDECFI